MLRLVLFEAEGGLGMRLLPLLSLIRFFEGVVGEWCLLVLMVEWMMWMWVRGVECVDRIELLK